MNGISKQKQKYIQSLHIKKYRQQYGVFLVEGRKSIEELLRSNFEIEELFLTEKVAVLYPEVKSFVACSEAELAKVSFYKTNTFGLAIVKTKKNSEPETDSSQWVLALDDIKDPGNLGTIIRTADWYGINTLVCSPDTVDFYNPKVIASTMGSFSRMNVFYIDLKTYFNQNKRSVYGAFLDGENVHKVKFEEAGILLIGSESHGISQDLKAFVKHSLTIPQFGGAESLNAGIATAILLDNIKRGGSGA